MKTAWLTYAWKDNERAAQGDVDYIIQELERHQISIRTDRRDLIVGRPLWPQIEAHITDEALCDAWAFLITASSLASKPCQEELLYALDRALDKRKALFPIIGIFIGGFPSDLPKALAVRLCVSTEEPNWAARVASGIRGEKLPMAVSSLQPFHAHLCTTTQPNADHIFEVRPRLGSWAPFCFGVAKSDGPRLVYASYAASTGDPPNCYVGHASTSMSSTLADWEEDGWLWRGVASPAVTSAIAAHIRLKLDSAPLQLRFGQRGGALFTVTLPPYAG